MSAQDAVPASERPVSLAGDVVVVTGAGRGLGRAYAIAAAACGAAVVVNDVDGDVADEVVHEIAVAGGSAVAAIASVADEAGARSVVAAAVASFGTIDALVNNAGIMRNGYLEDISSERFDEVVGISLRGSFLTTRAAWPTMRTRGRGRVVMITSSGGLFANQGSSNYAAAKAGAYGLCRSLAVEGAEHGIRVNAVAPMGGTMHSMDPLPGYAERYPAHLREPLAARRAPEAVAPLVVYLCSSACTVTGETFAAGFGRFARVFVAETPGWVAPDPWAIVPEDVSRHLDEIRHLDGFAVPRHVYDEIEFIGARLGLGRARDEQEDGG